MSSIQNFFMIFKDNDRAVVVVLIAAVVVVVLAVLLFRAVDRVLEQDRKIEDSDLSQVDRREMPRGARLLMVMIGVAVLLVVLFLIAGRGITLLNTGFLSLATLIVVTIACYVYLVNWLSNAARRNGILDPRHPFGLPEGTVRAILTLSFIVLVGVLGAYLITAHNNRPLYAPQGEVIQTYTGDEGLAAAEALAGALRGQLGREGLVILATEGAGAAAVHRVVVRTRIDHSMGDEIAKQMLTIISTILAAMIGFYFAERGTRAGDAEETRAAIAKAQLGWPLQRLGDRLSELIRVAARVEARLGEAGLEAATKT